MLGMPVHLRLVLPERFNCDSCPLVNLPPYMDGDIDLFAFNENSRNGTHWFFKMLDELQKEYDDSGGGHAEGFIHNKTCLLQAWHEHRLFGLKMSRTESLYNHHPPHLSTVYKYIWTNYAAREDEVRYALPLFCVTQEPGSPHDWDMDNAIEYLWVAKRARGLGLGRRMAREMCCNTVSEPLEDALAFWSKLGYQVPSVEEKKRKIRDY